MSRALTLWVAALGVAWALGSPATSEATSIEADRVNTGVLVVSDKASETNEMTIRAEVGELVFSDVGAGTMLTTTAPGCIVRTAQEVRCVSLGVRAVNAQLGGGDDILHFDDTVVTVAGIASATLEGGEGDDQLDAGVGDQNLFGNAGNDTLVGGAGDDKLYGVSGNDTAFGGPGDDELHGGNGVDHLSGGDGRDLVRGQDGDDVLDGGGGDDDVRGGEGSDLVAGGEGDDRLDVPVAEANDPGAARGADRLRGGPGNDRLGGGEEEEAPDADVLSGGDGVDIADFSARSSSIRIDLDGIDNDGRPGEHDDVQPDVENVIGGSDSDTLLGSAAANVLDGRNGDDRVSGREGDDTLEGGRDNAGSDTLSGGEGRDTLIGGPGDDALEGGAGGDVLFGGGGGDALDGGAGDDTLYGGAGRDDLDGGEGDDRLDGAEPDLIGADGGDDLKGGPGADVLQGGAGDDELDGGTGADVISGEAGRDTVSYENRSSPVTVTLDGLPNDGEDGEGDNVAADVEAVRGGSVGDDLTGNGESNRLDGESGEDLVDGGAGRDVLAGGNASDVMRARDGEADIVACGDDDDLAIIDRRDTVRDCEWIDPGGDRPPVAGRSALLTPVETSAGYRLRLPGGRRFFALAEDVRVPVGSTIDARAGEVRVETTLGRGAVRQEVIASTGMFSLRQRLGRLGQTELRLRGGFLGRCRGSSARTAGATRQLRLRSPEPRPNRRRRRPERLVVIGRYVTAAPRGTTWMMQDRCDGTLTAVETGTVTVYDRVRRRTVTIRAGATYLARAPND